MIRPASFGSNPQTASTNYFQHGHDPSPATAAMVRTEFNAFAALLSSQGVDVVVFDDHAVPHTPDAVFPNNWISFHEDGHLVLYPMMAENRRLERRTDIANHFSSTHHTIIDLSHHEKNNDFLEGTGSIVFDYEHRIAYACLSPRTSPMLLRELCQKIGFSPFIFEAADKNGREIYHTNVLMCIGNGFAVVCAEALKDEKPVLEMLESSGHAVIRISHEQMNSFAGNMYQLFDSDGNGLIIMSSNAYNSLTDEQSHILNKFGKLVHSPLNTIERHGGGSARCMIAHVR